MNERMIFESHAHYDDRRFDKDRDELLLSLDRFNIGTVVNISADYEGMKDCRELANKYDFVYSTAGIHPSEIKDLPDDAEALIEECAKEAKCLAIGEIGLDYHWEKTPDGRAFQAEWFRKQLDIAKRLDMPVVIHSRDACEDTMNILKSDAAEGLVCDIHCFSYSPEIAAEYVKMGYYIGVGGVITYDNSKKLRDTVASIPLENILLETDCPYLTPYPFKGQRNDSTYLPYVVKAIAGIKGFTEESVIEVTAKNAKRFYRL